jgi:hypothetical protein
MNAKNISAKTFLRLLSCVFVVTALMAAIFFAAVKTSKTASAATGLAAGQYYYISSETYKSFGDSFAYAKELFLYSIQGLANRNGPLMLIDRGTGSSYPYWRNPDAISDWVKILQNDPDIAAISGTNYAPVSVSAAKLLETARNLGIKNYFFWNVQTGISTHNWDWMDYGKSPAKAAAYTYAGAKDSIAIPYYIQNGQRLPAINIGYATVNELENYLKSLGMTSAQGGFDNFTAAVNSYIQNNNPDEYAARKFMYDWMITNWLDNPSFGLDKNYFCALGEFADDQCVQNKAFTFVLNFWPNDPAPDRIKQTLATPKDDHDMIEKILSRSNTAAKVLGWGVGPEGWYCYTVSKYGDVVAQTIGPDFSFFSKIPVKEQYLAAPPPKTNFQYDESKYYTAVLGTDSALAAPSSLFHDSFAYDSGTGQGKFLNSAPVNWGIDAAFAEEAPILGAYFFKKSRTGLDFFESGAGGDYFYALAVARNKGIGALDNIVSRIKNYYSLSQMSFFSNPWSSWGETQDIQPGADNDVIKGAYPGTYNDNPDSIMFDHYFKPLKIKNAYFADDFSVKIADPNRQSVFTLGGGSDKTTIVTRTAANNADFFGFNAKNSGDFSAKFNLFKSAYDKKTPFIWFTNIYGPTASDIVKSGGTDLNLLNQIQTSYAGELKLTTLDELLYMANLLYNNGLANGAFSDASGWSYSGGASVAASDFAQSTGKSLQITDYGFAYQQPAVLNNAAGKHFTLTFWAKKGTASDNPMAVIQELPSWSAKAIAYVDSTDWKQYTLNFDINASNQYLVALTTSQTNKGKVYFDDVRLVETGGLTIFQACVPNSVVNCRVCNAAGTAWLDTDSKCGTDQKCRGGVCITLCTPQTCSSLGYNCGTASDGCGGMLNCGSCGSNQTCTANKCVANCASHASKKCDNGNLYWYNSCGIKEELAQNCGVNENTSSYQCSNTWIQQKTITKGCANNACFANPVWNNAQDCSATNQTCSNGSCVSSAATSTLPIICTPKTCADLGYFCGTALDGCGGTLNCGICSNNNTCYKGACVAQDTANIDVGTDLAALYAQIEYLKKEISRVQALLAAKNQTTISCTQLTKDLYYGIKNDPEVKCLQEFLKIQGLFNGPITGSFYTLTKTTVIAFQEKYSSEILTPLGLTHGTGIVAGNTRAKINKLLLMGN